MVGAEEGSTGERKSGSPQAAQPFARLIVSDWLAIQRPKSPGFVSSSGQLRRGSRRQRGGEAAAITSQVCFGNGQSRIETCDFSPPVSSQPTGRNVQPGSFGNCPCFGYRLCPRTLLGCVLDKSILPVNGQRNRACLLRISHRWAFDSFRQV
jgi:hypothetical protein